MKTQQLSDGTPMPSLGLGTWQMGESPSSRATEYAALRHALDRGVVLFDTAEMYGDGGAETLLGDAIAKSGRAREGLFIVSKVYPWNASEAGVVKACERSLRRLGMDSLDLYLLHWRGQFPLAETVAGMETLKRQGKIARWGVSNFDTPDIRELMQLAPSPACVVNQVYYNLGKRWPEATLLRLSDQHRIATMAYSPLDQGALLGNAALKKVAKDVGATAAQVALAWLLFKGVIAIPKTSKVDRVDEILAAGSVVLGAEHVRALEAAFSAPDKSATMETT